MDVVMRSVERKVKPRSSFEEGQDLERIGFGSGKTDRVNHIRSEDEASANPLNDYHGARIGTRKEMNASWNRDANHSDDREGEASSSFSSLLFGSRQVLSFGAHEKTFPVASAPNVGRVRE
jgi:hypothetical protein